MAQPKHHAAAACRGRLTIDPVKTSAHSLLISFDNGQRYQLQVWRYPPIHPGDGDTGQDKAKKRHEIGAVAVA